jgi:8-oxo-dGTP pyrophosphatase MutT (NUDIX family)
MDLRKIVGTMPLIMPGACVLLIHNSTLLLQRRTDNGMWGLPGGSLEPGESMEEVARRELFEETGLKAKSLELMNIFSGDELYYKYPHGDEVYNVVAAYVCKDFDGTLIQDYSEVEEINFFNIKEIPDDISPPDKPVIQEYLRRIYTEEEI